MCPRRLLRVTRSSPTSTSIHRETPVAPESTEGETAIHKPIGMLSSTGGDDFAECDNRPGDNQRAREVVAVCRSSCHSEYGGGGARRKTMNGSGAVRR